MEHALEIRRLRKEYPGFTLRDVSFDLPPGAIMGLIGPNGAGKTTVIKLILNVVRPTGGEVRVFGLDSQEREAEAKSRIGFVLDEPAFTGYLRVGAIGSIVAPFYPTWDAGRFRDLCREFEIPRGRRVNALSRGMRMKLALAVALSHSAGLILLDEPTSGLDPVFRRELLERLSGLIQDGRTSVLFSTHITSDLERIADYITCLKDGELLFSSSRDEILDRWGLVKGGPELFTDETGDLYRSVHRGAYGWTALTADRDKARRHLAGKEAVIEPVRLDDLVFFLGRESGPGGEDSHA
jgi:ABC-2 type transport system ATP-binding protein